MEHDDRSRWNARYAGVEPPQRPAAFLVERAHLLPVRGTALDVAGGGGRHACWLASRGLTVTLVDVSDEACRLTTERAAAAGLPVRAVRRDVTTDGLPAGGWDLVLLHHFLDRDVIAAAPRSLTPGGLLLVCQPTVRNLQRHARPSRRWLLEEGELRALVEALPAVEVVAYEEGWTDEDRHEAMLALRGRRSADAPETPAPRR